MDISKSIKRIVIGNMDWYKEYTGVNLFLNQIYAYEK